MIIIVKYQLLLFCATKIKVMLAHLQQSVAVAGSTMEKTKKSFSATADKTSRVNVRLDEMVSSVGRITTSAHRSWSQQKSKALLARRSARTWSPTVIRSNRSSPAATQRSRHFGRAKFASHLRND
tara:strand:- start:91271 stop:91645 length:375 start_codon:yes stop_codon:yes gene_type:complete